MTPFAHGFPVPGFLVRHRCRRGEERRAIAGALNLIARHELALWPVMVVPFHPPPGDDRRLQPSLLVRASIEKPGTLRCAEPLVKVTGVKIDSTGSKVDGPLTDGVRAIDDR